jgi:toxin ParE1/3/4
MARVVRTFPARDDLEQIWLYIAERNPLAADRLIDKLERTLFSISRNPQLGETADQYRAGLRRFTVGKYVLYFEPIHDGIRLIRVLHGARRIDELFE